MAQKVLAIDPGSEQSAFVVWDGKQILDKGILENDYLVRALKNYVFRNISIYNTILVIEDMVIIFKGAGKEITDTLKWAGRFFEAWGGTAVFVPRYKVRVALCGTMQSTDATVRNVLVARFGGKEVAVGKKASPGPLYGVKKDMWSALALAVYYYDQLVYKLKKGEKV